MVDHKLIASVLKGFLTFVPGVNCLARVWKRKSKHSGYSAVFCYTLWLSILVKIDERKLIVDLNKIGELGCGGSVGVGICALLTGTKEYFGLEIENNFDKNSNLKLLDDIIDLFRNRTPLPIRFKQLNIKISDKTYPDKLIRPRFNDFVFISELKKDIENNCSINSKHMKIICNWQDNAISNFSFIFSRAVLEHVNNPEKIYRNIDMKLLKGAFMFHDIEFHSHDLTQEVNGQYTISPFVWKIISGNRHFFLNRWTLSDHIKALKSMNFQIVLNESNFVPSSDSTYRDLLGSVLIAKKV